MTMMIFLWILASFLMGGFFGLVIGVLMIRKTEGELEMEKMFETKERDIKEVMGGK